MKRPAFTPDAMFFFWFWWVVKWWFITLGSAVAVYFALRALQGRSGKRATIDKSLAYVGATLWMGSFPFGFVTGQYPYLMGGVGVLMVCGVTAARRKSG